MEAAIQNQLKKYFDTLRSAIERRDIDEIVSTVGKETQINAFGDYLDSDDLGAALKIFFQGVEEIAISDTTLIKVTESKKISSVVSDVTISFVETQGWSLKRYTVRVSLGYTVVRKNVAVRFISLSDLRNIGILKPGFIEGIGGGFGPILGGVSDAEVLGWDRFGRVAPTGWSGGGGYPPYPYPPFPPYPYPPYPYPPFPDPRITRWPWGGDFGGFGPILGGVSDIDPGEIKFWR